MKYFISPDASPSTLLNIESTIKLIKGHFRTSIESRIDDSNREYLYEINYNVSDKFLDILIPKTFDSLVFDTNMLCEMYAFINELRKEFSVKDNVLLYNESYDIVIPIPNEGISLKLFENEFCNNSKNQNETLQADNMDIIPYKTYLGKDYTKEEWKKFEEEEYRKYVEKRSGKKSSFLADETEEIKNQNFSAESGTLKEVKYFVMNSRQDKVPVYEFPSAMVAPFTFLENGTAIEIVKYEKDGWCEILSKDKKKAYIQSTHVKKNE